MLRKVRLTLAVIFYSLITLMFLDFTGTLHHWLGWLAKIQFLPALLALNVGVVVALLLTTFVFGRIYCSVICPLGVMQDVVSWVSARRKKKKYRFSYSSAKSWLRYGILALFVVAMLAGVTGVAALVAPYSAYGRIAQSLFQPVYLVINNGLAYLAERVDSYTFYSADVWMRSGLVLAVSATTFVVLAVLAWRNGRTYCNTICPVGTVLSFVSRFSLLKVRIDTEKCNSCGLCARSCKSACIDHKNHKIDYSRCVACGNCLGQCRRGALSYGTKKPTPKVETKVDESRRAFMVGAVALAATSAMAQQKKKVDGGLAVIEDKKAIERTTPLTPPGSVSARNMQQHCTACQLCVSECPNGVLRASTGLATFMQPTMSYEHGYCRPECNRCSTVCPAGAIKPIDVAEKSSIQIGHAVWVRKNCVPLTDGVECGNCARHCPAGAITMVPARPDDDESPMVPAVNTERCIGCGACENLCPARPFSAIYVEGHEAHRRI